MRVAVLASGHGSNLQSLLDAFSGPSSPATIALVISNQAAAGALGRAAAAGVATATIAEDGQDTARLLALLAEHAIDLVVLAGYLKIVPEPVVKVYRGRMLNVHPALLPSFGGAGMYGRRVHEAVLASGARITGVTVHQVDEQYDHGPIVAQWPVPVRPGDTAERLAARVLAVEHKLLPAVVAAFARSGGGARGSAACRPRRSARSQRSLPRSTMRWPSRSVLLAAALLRLPAPARAQSLDSLVVRLADMSAVSGYEDAMADSLLAALPGSVLDRAGNVVWTRGGGAPVRVALCPMDEVGYVVGAITPEGYLTLRRVGATPMGPLFDQSLEGQRVTVFGRHGPVPGVVGVRSVHLARGRPAAGDEPFSLDNAFVDVGAQSATGAAELGIGILSPVTRAKRAHRYGLDLVAAPWAAARAGCAALLAAALRPPEGGAGGTAVVAFTRRRQFRWDGAAFLLGERAPAAARTDVVVVGEAGPGDSLDLGAAPAWRDSLPAGDAWRATVAWSLPTRYPRTSVETVSLRDVATLADRLRQFLGGAR